MRMQIVDCKDYVQECMEAISNNCELYDVDGDVIIDDIIGHLTINYDGFVPKQTGNYGLCQDDFYKSINAMVKRIKPFLGSFIHCELEMVKRTTYDAVYKVTLLI